MQSAAESSSSLTNLTTSGKEETVNLQFRHNPNQYHHFNVHLERPRLLDHHNPLELLLGSEIAAESDRIPYSYDYLPPVSPLATIAGRAC